MIVGYNIVKFLEIFNRDLYYLFFDIWLNK